MKPTPYGPFPYSAINRRPKLTLPNGARVPLEQPDWQTRTWPELKSETLARAQRGAYPLGVVGS